MAQLEVKKMKQGMSYSCKEKTIILNVFKYFSSQNADLCVTELVRRTAKATGCSEKSIFQFRKEECSVEGFKQPSKTKIRRNININSRFIKYDQSVRDSIRNIIYDLKYKNIIPSLSTILKQIKANINLPKFSLMTLRRLLFDMGFTYEKNGNKFLLVEKDEKNILPPKPVALNNANVKSVVNDYSPLPQHSINNLSNPAVPKPVSQINHSNHLGASVSQHNLLDVQQHRLIPMHVPHHEAHIMPPPMHHLHNNMPPVMLNPGMSVPSSHHHGMSSNRDMHIKHDISPWIHHTSSQNMVKQQ